MNAEERRSVKASARRKSYDIYRKIIRILKQSEENDEAKGKTRALIISGIPGSGKTTSLLYLALYRTNRCIVSFSRRRQRDWWFENIPRIFNLRVRTRISDDIYEVETRDGKIIAIYRFKAKYEFDDCSLSRKEFDSFLDYMLACIKSQETLQCRYNCPYRRQFSIVANLIRSRRNFIVLATHVGGMVLDMVFEGLMHIIIDEFDEYVFSLSHLAIPKRKLDEYYIYGDDITRKIVDDIRQNWVFNPRNQMYYPPLLPIHAKCAILSTATFVRYFVAFYRGVYAIDIHHVEPTYGERDEILVLRKRFRIYDFASDSSPIYRYVTEMVKLAYSKGKNIGIVVPKKIVAQHLAKTLEPIGNVYCETYPDTSRQWITIVVPGDTLYRGLSIDADVVIAFYQYWNFQRTLDSAHPWIESVWRPPSEASRDPMLRGLVDRYGYIDPLNIERAIEELNQAYNAQAIFRFIRNHRKKHIVIILDESMYEAMKYFFSKTYLAHCNVHTFDDFVPLIVRYASLL